MKKIFLLIMIVVQGCNPGDSITRAVIESTQKKIQVGCVSDLSKRSYQFVCELPGQQIGWRILVEGNPFVSEGIYENNLLNTVKARVYVKNLSTHAIEAMYTGEDRGVIESQMERLLFNNAMEKMFYDSIFQSGIWIFTNNQNTKLEIRFEIEKSVELVRPIRIYSYRSDNI